MSLTRLFRELLSILAITICLASPTLLAQEHTLSLAAGTSTVNLNDTLRWRFVTALIETDLLPGLTGFQLPASQTDFGSSNETLILHTSLNVHGTEPRDWFLEIDYAPLDVVDITLFNRQLNVVYKNTVGDSQPAAVRQIAHPHYLVSLPLKNTDSYELFLQISSGTKLLAPVFLHSGSTIISRHTNFGLLQGMYYGILLALTIYNFFLSSVIKDVSYLYYGLYLLTMGGLLFSMEGYSALYFWPDNPWLADRASIIFGSFCMYVGLEFARLIANAITNAPRHYAIAGKVKYLSLIPLLLVVAFSPSIALPILLTLATVVIVLIVNMLILAIVNGSKHARFVTAAFACLIPGCIVLIVHQVSTVVLPSWSQYLLQFGTAAEALLLSLALAQKYESLRSEKEKLLAQSIIAEQQAHDAQINFSQRLLSSQDTEQQRLAAELHDGVAQNLALIANNLKRASESKVHFNTASMLTTETIQELRNITSNLYPYLLGQLGLGKAVETTLSRALGPSNIEYNLIGFESLNKLHNSTELQLFRIIQEALSNIVKHSRASFASVNIAISGNDCVLIIEDNGKFQTAKSNSGGLGLESMRQRAKALNGELSFKHSENSGSSVILKFPLNQPWD